MVDITIVIINMMMMGVAMQLVKEATKYEHYDLNIPPWQNTTSSLLPIVVI